MLHTSRLDLVNCDLDLIGHVLKGNAALAAATGWTVLDDWTEFGEPIFVYTAERLKTAPEDAGWWTWLPILRSENALIGSCGYKGAPNADGEVEIGYEVAASHRQQGYATEFAQALVAHAFASEAVRMVIAHTLPAENPSTRVLQNCGFVHVGESVDPDEGAVWRWELPRATYANNGKPKVGYPLRLETARLFTRPVMHSDLAAWQQFMGHAEATRYFPNPDNLQPDVRARQWIDRQHGRYVSGGYGMLALLHKDTGTFIGQCGLLKQTVDDVVELEVGYHVFPQHWRQGYASEAATALRDLGFATTDTESIISIIHRDNVPSQGVALRNGMQREKATQYLGIDVYVYRIWRSEWERLKTSQP